MKLFTKSLSITRNYSGPIRACILDWSGTVSDKYVIAPAKTFIKAFSLKGIEVSMEQARKPMGIRKDLHIAEMAKEFDIIKQWENQYGRPITEEDIQNIYEDFVPLQLECLDQYSKLIPQVGETIQYLQSNKKIKFGSTTGFTRDMVDILNNSAEKQGLFLDSTVAGDEVQTGWRPTPHMLYKNLDLLDIHPIKAVVKIDDTASGIGEGLNAGCWTVGVSRYSNYMNIDSFEHEKTLTEKELSKRNIQSGNKLHRAGAHFVIDSIADLPDIIDEINNRLKRGIEPNPHRPKRNMPYADLPDLKI